MLRTIFYAVIHGIMHHKLKGQNVKLENAKETLGDDFFLKLKEVETSVMLDYTLFGYFERCRLINETLSKEDYFLRFYDFILLCWQDRLYIFFW